MDKTTAFSLEEEYPEGGFFQGGEYYIPRPSFSRKKPSKNDMIYGIFNEEEGSSDDEEDIFRSSLGFQKLQEFEPEEEAAKDKSLAGRYPNFKRSNHILYEPTKKIQVKYANNKEKALNDEDNTNKDLIKDLDDLDESPNNNINNNNSNKENPSKKKSHLRAKRVFDFKKKNSSNLQAFDLPEALGAVKKKPKVEKLEKSSLQISQEAQKLKEQYGKGYLMIKNLGFELGKGLGKEKQGRLKPVEAIQKTAYNSNFENRLEEKEKKYTFTSENAAEMSEFNQNQEDDTEKIVKRWSKTRKTSKKKQPLLPQELNQDKVFLNNVPQKIVDMRGATPVFIEQVAVGSIEKKGVLAELLLILKTEYEISKHKLHETMRKVRTEEDQIMANSYEIQVLEQKSTQLKTDKQFLTDSQILLRCLQSLSLEELLSEFSTFCKKHPKKVLEFELYLYFLKEFARKIRNSVSLPTLRADLQTCFPHFRKISLILIELFPKNLKIDPLEPAKQGFLTKTPRKLIKNTFDASLLPIMRTYITNEFSLMNDTEEMLQFLKDWKEILSEKLITEVFESLIQPKIEKEIKDYEPLKQKYPVHIWFFHWMPWIKEELWVSLTKILQLKFIKALNVLEIKDISALNLIKPWKGIMGNELWDSLIKRAVLPKLMFLAFEIKIQPQNQNIEPVKALLQWVDLLDFKDLELLFANNLLKKLVETLMEWVKMPKRKKEEIQGWFDGWKSFLPEKIVKIGEYFENMRKIIEGI